jgi:triacylglycerol lipase
MSANTLAPEFAAKLADRVYLVSDEITRRLLITDFKNNFDLSEAEFIKGKTGAFCFLKNHHVIGFLCKGIGKYKNEAFVVFKGTASLYDALTDLNTGIKASSTGLRVHQGFQYAFESVLTELKQFSSSLQGISVVHCVGHSLGGAIATLAADWLASYGCAGEVKLYTFGSPRVGLEMFAQKLTTKLKEKNIYRVYHKTDPVPMVPTWPFLHVPTGFNDYLIDSPISGAPWEYHFMKHYIKSAEKAGDWKTIQRNRPNTYEQRIVEQWLKSDSALAFTQSTLELVNAALIFLLKKIAHAGGIVLVGGFATAFTLLDRLAMILAKAVDISELIGEWVYCFVKKVAALVGIVVVKETNLTLELIRYIFLMLHRKVSEMIFGLKNKM